MGKRNIPPDLESKELRVISLSSHPEVISADCWGFDYSCRIIFLKRKSYNRRDWCQLISATLLQWKVICSLPLGQFWPYQYAKHIGRSVCEMHFPFPNTLCCLQDLSWWLWNSASSETYQLTYGAREVNLFPIRYVIFYRSLGQESRGNLKVLHGCL